MSTSRNKTPNPTANRRSSFGQPSTNVAPSTDPSQRGSSSPVSSRRSLQHTNSSFNLASESPSSASNSQSNGAVDVSSNASDAIKVICRFRPNKANANERNSNKSKEEEAFKLDESRSEVEFGSMYQDRKLFTFDKVFGDQTKQSQMFNEVKGVVDSVMAGFNGTVMAYGQTSAGKSFTMEGLSLWDAETQGVIPRCIDLLFEKINNADSQIQFQVVVSFYEIYCEKVRDLLNPQAVNLKVRETKEDGFKVQDVTEIYCTDRDSVLRVIEFGKANRASAPTLMNAESSRSHSIVSILVDQNSGSTGRHRKGSLFLVDLAGSEKVSKTGASGMRLEEAKNINGSLTTLGMVINALCDGSSHVPYRDSKLTMILMEALGGNSKTTLIICCSGESKHSPETLSTLRFGERAKRIKNHAKVNEDLSVEELKALLAAAQKEILVLKKRVKGNNETLDDGGKLDQPEDNEFQSKLSAEATAMAEAKIEELRSEIGMLKSRLSSLEEDLETERMRYKEEHDQCMFLTTESSALKLTITDLEAKLLQSALNIKKLESNAKAQAEIAESELKEIAQAADSEANGSVPVQEEDTKAPPPKPPRLPPPRPPRRPSRSGKPLPFGNNFEITDEVMTQRISMEDLEEETNQLRHQLEEEVRSLNMTVSQQASEARSAQATANIYAEKYIKLREDYEVHVQRLMIKLTQEQQARGIVEDQLDDATRKVWHFENREREDASKSFFGQMFNNFKSPASYSQYIPPAFARRGSFSDKDQQSSRLFELAQMKIAQLVQEHEALNEAHSIVLETKESVMRSLARQNTELSIERDNQQRRIEELTTTVDQLTSLLRSVQSRPKDLASPNPSQRSASFISGGMSMGSLSGGRRPVLNISSLSASASRDEADQGSSPETPAIREETPSAPDRLDVEVEKEKEEEEESTDAL